MQVEINRHSPNEWKADFLIEFEVKFPSIPADFPEDLWEAEYTTGSFTNSYADRCYQEICRGGYSWLTDWSFAGRSNGWFVLLCSGEPEKVQEKTLHRMESIVQRYFLNYGRELAKSYAPYMKTSNTQI